MQFRYFRLHFVQIIALLKECVLQKRDSLLTVSFLYTRRDGIAGSRALPRI